MITFEELVAPLDDPLCRPENRLKAAAERLFWNVRDFFPDERLAEAERLAKAFTAEAAEFLQRGDDQSAARLVGPFAQKLRELSVPIRVPTKGEQIEKIAPVLVGRDGWAGIEIDLLRDALRDQEKIVGYDHQKVTTDQRTITRLEPGADAGGLGTARAAQLTKRRDFGRASASFFGRLSVFEKSEQILRHAPHLDFLRSLRDAIAPVMPEDVLEWFMPRVPDRAMHLHRAVRRFAHQPVRPVIAHGDLVGKFERDLGL